MIGVPLQIGPVRLSSNLLLAPIAGWCDLAWRQTIREIGPVVGQGIDPRTGERVPVPGVGLACTDLLSPQGLIRGCENSAELARTNAFDKPLGMQLYGADPVALADGARWCVDHGADVVDINMGCPVDKVTKKDGGSKLMCNVPGAWRLAEAVRRALPDHVPLTCKMRLGWDEAAYERNVAGELACGLCEVGVAAITVHGRTTAQLFKGSVRLDGIRRVVEAVGERTGAYTGVERGRVDAAGMRVGGVPVIGNGDVTTVDAAIEMLRATGCAGVMIGRGAFSTPWLFRDAWQAQRERASGEADDGVVVEPLTELERTGIVRTYFARLLEVRGESKAMHIIRQKISWLGKGINGSHCRPLKQAIVAASTPESVFAALSAWESGELGGPGEARAVGDSPEQVSVGGGVEM